MQNNTHTPALNDPATCAACASNIATAPAQCPRGPLKAAPRMTDAEWATLKAEIAEAGRVSRRRAYVLDVDDDEPAAGDDGDACTCARCTEEMPVEPADAVATYLHGPKRTD